MTLGEVLHVTEATPGAIPVRMQGMIEARAARGPVPVAAGELEIVATVDVAIAIR